jgi:hypothetical protein
MTNIRCDNHYNSLFSQSVKKVYVFWSIRHEPGQPEVRHAARARKDNHARYDTAWK